MAMLAFLGGREPDDDMARAALKPLDAEKIQSWVGELKRTVYDRAAFEAVFAQLGSDKTFSAPELLEIARLFAHGHKAKNKKDALLAIGQERIRLANGRAKGTSASKTPSW